MEEGKQRLDLTLLRRGLISSRERAKEQIAGGTVYVNGLRERRAGRGISEADDVELRGAQLLPFVSRGGSKLQKAVEEFGLLLEGGVCMDVGASTGGFTDCMLCHGAAKVYAIDVGSGQLAGKLRGDARVICLEQTNFRHVTGSQVPEPIDFASVDVSFISLRLIFPVLFSLLAPQGSAVCLVKPQFEAGRERLGKKGVVRDPKVHSAVLGEVLQAARQQGFFAHGLSFSPITGADGNREYLLLLKKEPPAEGFSLPEAAAVVQAAIGVLGA